MYIGVCESESERDVGLTGLVDLKRRKEAESRTIMVIVIIPTIYMYIYIRLRIDSPGGYEDQKSSKSPVLLLPTAPA